MSEQIQKRRQPERREEPEIQPLPEPVEESRLKDAVAYVLELIREVLYE